MDVYFTADIKLFLEHFGMTGANYACCTGDQWCLWLCVCVCGLVGLCFSPRFTKKTAWAINVKFGTLHMYSMAVT